MPLACCCSAVAQGGACARSRRGWCVLRHIPEHPEVVADIARHDAAGYVLLSLMLEAGQLPHPRGIGWVICVQV